MANEPESRRWLYPRLVQYCARRLQLPLEPARAAAAAELGGWLRRQLQAAKPARVIVICTGNSRRSVLGAVLGNVAAAYAGLSEVRFSSGGTEPTAVNERTLRALEDVGIVVEPTEPLAAPGPAGEPNPVYRLRWGEAPAREACAMFEFSKHYTDATNPQSDFAAVMVCDQANDACPFIPGAAARIAMPVADPKMQDGTPLEEAAYRERRDEIARALLAAVLPERGDPRRHR